MCKHPKQLENSARVLGLQVLEVGKHGKLCWKYESTIPEIPNVITMALIKHRLNDGMM